MNHISSQRLSTTTWVRWQCSQNISCISKGKGLLGPNGGSGGKFEGGFGENVGSCGGKGKRGGSIAGRGGGLLARRSMGSKEGLGGGGFVVLGGRSSSESKIVRGEEGGVKNKSSMGSKFMDNGEECLDGWVGADGGEVKGGGVDFRVSRTLLGEIPKEIMGKVVVKHLGLMEEPLDNQWVVIEYDKDGTPVEGWRNNKDGH
nr:hypothetical protein [Tanacetum cinerariifolium]